MSEFFKPQSPLNKDGVYFYPLTTEDQVIMDDGSRLSSTLEDIKDKIDNIDFSNLDLEGVAYLGETLDSAVAPINADTLGGRPASEYVLQSEIGGINGSGVGKADVGEGAEIFNCYEETEFELGYIDEKTHVLLVNKAVGEYSHAEGVGTVASGSYSHAEGQQTESRGQNSHTEGERTVAYGRASHAEGRSRGSKLVLSGDANSKTYTFDANCDGSFDLAVGKIVSLGDICAIIEEVNQNTYTITLSKTLSADAIVNKEAQVLLGVAYGYFSHVEGQMSTASGSSSHAEGFETLSSGDESHAEGYLTIASGDESHAEGVFTVASGEASHAEGDCTTASGEASHAEGDCTTASGEASHAEGQDTVASSYVQHAQGKYNIGDSSNQYAHIVGNGSRTGGRSNAHTLDWTGNAVFAGAVSAPGADYAEHFEWLDGNPNNEDRVGTIVALDGDKIRPATADDEILGVVSGTAMVIGDNAEWEWQGKFLTDDYGRVITEKVEEFVEIKDPKTGEVIDKKSVGFIKRRKLNPEWDATKEYTRRSDRPEWDVVGLFGKLHVTDDGTCVPNGWATVGEDGKATASATKTNMRVMKRITDNIILVFMK